MGIESLLCITVQLVKHRSHQMLDDSKTCATRGTERGAPRAGIAPVLSLFLAIEKRMVGGVPAAWNATCSEQTQHPPIISRVDDHERQVLA